MPEYIEREAAVKVAEKYGLANGSALGRHTGLADCIASEIADIPAADVAPVVHGRWVCVDTDTEQFFLCNKCKKKEYCESNYCQNCGCRMDGGESDATDRCRRTY